MPVTIRRIVFSDPDVVFFRGVCAGLLDVVTELHGLG